MLLTIDHQPTTRAILVLRYNITLAWRGGLCGLCPQHAAMTLWVMWAMRLQFHLWAMWAICFAIAHMTHSLRRGHVGTGVVGNVGIVAIRLGEGREKLNTKRGDLWAMWA